MLRRNLLLAGLAGFAVLGAAGYALSQVIPVPQVTQINAGDLFQDIVNGAPQVGNQYAPAPLLGNYAASLPGNNPTNDLIGGDFGINLFQDGTSTAGVNTTATYVADQWAAFSGTSTSLTGAQETAAADITAGYTASLRITRTGTGVIQSCVAQIIPSGNVPRYQGGTAEVDFHALAGSGFSAASSNLNVLLVTGTGTNDTMANLAKTINSALSGTAWAGAATSTVTIPISTQWHRYTAAFPVPAAATELGVALCWTPVGASPSSDYFEFTGAQLTPNNALVSVAGTAGGALNPDDPRAKSFYRRPQSLDQDLQYAFYYRVNETATARPWLGQVLTTSTANIKIPFPVPMYAVPTGSYTAGGWSVTVAAGTSGANQVCASLATVASSVTTFGGTVLCTATSGIVAGNATELIGTLTTGKVAFSARF